MKRRLALAAITALFTGTAADAQTQGPFEVTLSTDRVNYGAADTAEIRLTLRNRGSGPIYILTRFSWGVSASYSIWAKDARTRKNIPPNFTADEVTPPPRSTDAFRRIAPGQFYDVLVKVRLSDLNLDKPGGYELLAECHSPVPARMNFGLPIWSREMGPIVSNTVVITVR